MPKPRVTGPVQPAGVAFCAEPPVSLRMSLSSTTSSEATPATFRSNPTFHPATWLPRYTMNRFCGVVQYLQVKCDKSFQPQFSKIFSSVKPNLTPEVLSESSERALNCYSATQNDNRPLMPLSVAALDHVQRRERCGAVPWTIIHNIGSSLHIEWGGGGGGRAQPMKK
jgi:hypothetical protein